MDLLKQFISNIREEHLFTSKDKLLLAVSGGVDSVVLCELCKQAGLDFQVAHCNFQLRGEESNRDEAFVKELAAGYGVPLHINHFDTAAIAKATKKSIEETARDLRYRWFHQLSEAHLLPFILTGHQADDNIETMAMQFFRGTGIKGLRGMLVKNGKIIRPLLFARRTAIEDFASQHQLKYVTDSTNLEDAYARNFFRNRLIPLFKVVYPEVEQNLLHNLGRFAEVETLYEQAIAFHKKKLVKQKGTEFHIPVLQLKKAIPLRSIVYEIISEFNFTAKQTDEVIALLDSDTGKWVASSSHRVVKNRNWLIIGPCNTADAGHIVIEAGMTQVDFPQGHFSIAAGMNMPQSTNMATVDAKEVRFPLLLRRWKAGDYFYPLGMKKKKKISRFLIDQKMSLTDKEKLWVLESDGRIIWVIGQRIDERFKITAATRQGLQFNFRS